MTWHRAIAILALSTGCAAPEAADLILTNGRVYTLDEARPWAEAIAVDRWNARPERQAQHT